MKLRDVTVRSAKGSAKPYKLADGGGLYLYVAVTGGKLWRWDYRFSGKRKTFSFGCYPDLTLAEARARHHEARRHLKNGVDPSEQKREGLRMVAECHAHSFASVAERWHNHWKEGKSSRHADSTWRRLATNVLPHIGHLAVDKITAKQLVLVVLAVQKRGARDIAKRALETCSQIFRYSVAHGFADRNPATDIRPSDILRRAQARHYARVSARELPHLLRMIRSYSGRHVTRLAMEILALTFVRTNELIGARWSEIDFGAARWQIPAERMKMRTPHIVPLASQTLEKLEELRFLTGESEWLFPGERTPSIPMSNNTILKALERMGYKGQMTGHGFRGLASTIMHEAEYAHEHIELQLAHTSRDKVSAAYNHAQHLSARSKMMQDWADLLEKMRRAFKPADESPSEIPSLPGRKMAQAPLVGRSVSI